MILCVDLNISSRVVDVLLLDLLQWQLCSDEICEVCYKTFVLVVLAVHMLL